MEHRKKVNEEYPTLSLGEVSKKCGEAWAALDDHVKITWKDKAEQIKNSKKEESNEPVVEKKKRKPSNYLCFSMEYRKTVIESEPGLSLGEVSKRCGEAWKKLSAEEKETWKCKAESI